MRRVVRTALVSTAAIGIAGGGVAMYGMATLNRPGPPQRGYLALTGATVLAGESLEPVPGATVLIRDGRVTAVGVGVDVPAGSRVLDLRGRTVLPGLIDLHVHLGAPERERGEDVGPLQLPGLVFDSVRYVPGTRRAFLDHGVTAVRSLGDEHAWVMELRRMVRDGELEGPRVFAAGPIFTTSGGHPVAAFGIDPMSDSVRLPSTPEEARRAVAELAEAHGGVDVVKVVQERGGPRRALQPMAPEVLAAVVGEAHRHGLRVTAHWGTLADLDEALAAGVDGLEHLESRGVSAGWPAEALTTVVRRGLPVTPTLTVTSVALPEDEHRKLRSALHELHQAGGRVVLGTDAGMPGVPFGRSVHRELELLVDSGLSERQTLRTATSEAARVLGADDLGVVAPGYAADLLVVDGDPLRDIRATARVAMVLRDGRVVVGRS